MSGTLRRLFAYALDDARTAEDTLISGPGTPPQWLIDAAADPDQATFAVEVSTQSAELADAAVKSLQDKAGVHLNFVLALVPFALGATALALPSSAPSKAELVAILLLVAADAFLLAAVAMASLAGGLVLRGGISVDRLGDLADDLASTAPGNRVAALKAAQAEALRYAAQISYDAGKRIGLDLYASRRCTFLAVLFATLGVLALVAVRGLESLCET